MTITVGLFDSGLGGLSVLDTLYAQNPRAHYVYLADQRHFPYGHQPIASISAWTYEALAWIEKTYAVLQHMVIACHTISATLSLESHYGCMQLHDMIHATLACVRAHAHSRAKGVLLVTQATFDSGLYTPGWFQNNQVQGEWHAHACPHFASFVESAIFPALSFDEKVRFVKENVSLPQDVTHVVLGCTHYAFLKEALQYVLGAHIPVLDPALFFSLPENGSEKSEGHVSLITTKNSEEVFQESVEKRFLDNAPWLKKSKFYTIV